MPVWVPGVETKIYQGIAKIAARQLGRLDPVLSIYTKRSVACGEVTLGKSDIDLTILIEPLPDVRSEARFLRDLAARYAVLKRFFPCLGECEVGTRAELESWYRSQSYGWYWYRDRGWLNLYGEQFAKPYVPLSEGEGRDSVLWWFFWAWERLPDFYRAGNVRACCNLFLDMVNVYYLYLGAFHAPKRRVEVFEHWLATVPPSRERDKIQRGFQRGFRGNYRALKQWLYSESLKLCDALHPHVTRELAGKVSDAELRCQVPFSFSQRRYLLVDPLNREQVEHTLETMQTNTGVFVTSETALKLYLYHRNPWEYYTLKASNRDFPLSPPPQEALQRAVCFSLYKVVPRRAGFSIGRRADRSTTIGPRYAQCKLYVDHGIVATSAEDLLRQYQLRYGTWPYTQTVSRDGYFLHDYPIVCQIIEKISQQETFAMSIPQPSVPTGSQ
jgi:predicted nucleotidyltransferase